MVQVKGSHIKNLNTGIAWKGGGEVIFSSSFWVNFDNFRLFKILRINFSVEWPHIFLEVNNMTCYAVLSQNVY